MIKVLAIDDSLANLELIQDMLLSQEFEVAVASSGQTGIEKAQSFLPDLIICDIEMPNIDGFGVLETLRSQEQFKHTPFVFLTGVNTQESIDRGVDLGADDYLLKPFTLKKLISTVTTSFKKAKDLKTSFEQKSVTAEENVQKLQIYDASTGLLNSSTLAQNFLEIIARLDQKSLAIISFSIDRIEDYFDQFPTLGKTVSKFVANQLKKYYGADEKYLYYMGHQMFLVFLPFDQENARLTSSIEQLMYQVAQPLRIGRYDVEIALRAGISLYGVNGLELNDLIHKANQARVKTQSQPGRAYGFYV